MLYGINYGRQPMAHPDNAWREGLFLLAGRFRRSVALAVIFVAGGAAFGVGARYIMPASYISTTQLLFDPRGLKVFSNELTSGNYDANAAINFVESQMAVLQSEGVLARVLEKGCARAASDSVEAYCPTDTAKSDASRALFDLRKNVSTQRAERSFVVDIKTQAPTPESAARLGGDIVDAYRIEEAESRAAAARQLTAELNGRLNALREVLRKSEAKAARFRRDKNLLMVGDRLLVEQRLAAATSTLSEAQSKFDRAEARMHQVASALNNRAALGSLGVDADTRALQILLERRDQLRVEVAPIAARAGARHPALIEGRSKLNQVDGAIRVATDALKRTTQSDLARARNERDNIARTVADLSAKVTKAHQSLTELKTIEQEVFANRKLLESFETRSRETSEFGRIDSANLRVISAPTPPVRQNPVRGFVVWGAVGSVGGFVLAIGWMALGEMIATARRQRRRVHPTETDEDGTVVSLQMKADAFARYRYG